MPRRKRHGHVAQYGGGPGGDPAAPLFAGAYAWFRADLLAGNDADAITTWPDSSGNGRDVTQSTANAKPTLKTNIQNGLRVARFDGGDYLASGLTLAQPFTVIAAINATDTAVSKTIIGGLDNTNEAGFGLDASELATAYAGNNLQDFDAVSGFTVISGTFNGASSSVCSGNGTAQTGDVSTMTMALWGIGAKLTVPGQFFAGDMGEVFVHATAFSTTSVNAVASAMKARWNATWTNL